MADYSDYPKTIFAGGSQGAVDYYREDLYDKQAEQIAELTKDNAEYKKKAEIACGLLDDANIEIVELEKQIKAHEWVSVDDTRKPPEQTDVYIYGADGTVCVGKYWHLTGKWLVADARVYTGLEVTHWKPIATPTDKSKN